MSNKTKDFSMSPFRAIACGYRHSDLIRVADMIANDKPWDEVIIVSDKQQGRVRVVKKPSELPPIHSFHCTKRTLVIFDRCDLSVNADEMVVHDFSILGRMHGCSILFLECGLFDIPKYVKPDILYLTAAPRSWKWIKMYLNISQATEGLAAGLFKIDLRQRCRKIETIDALTEEETKRIRRD